MQATLADHVRSYLEDEEIALRPDDPASEVRTNTWTYSVAGSDREQAPEVIAALRDVAEGLRLRLQSSATRGKFYAWYDEQAGQLRCSLTSLHSLPFGAALREVADPSEILHIALSDPHPGAIDLSEAVEVPVDFVGALDSTLAVWVAQVP